MLQAGSGRGWEVNSGVLAMRREASWVIELWQAEFKAGLHLYEKLTGVDQSALMWVLAHEPRARLFTMPPLYNFRGPALYSRDLDSPAAFHSRAALRSPSKSATAKAMQRLFHTVAEAASSKVSIEDAATGKGGGSPQPILSRRPAARIAAHNHPHQQSASHHKRPQPMRKR